MRGLDAAGDFVFHSLDSDPVVLLVSDQTSGDVVFQYKTDTYVPPLLLLGVSFISAFVCVVSAEASLRRETARGRSTRAKRATSSSSNEPRR